MIELVLVSIFIDHKKTNISGCSREQPEIFVLSIMYIRFFLMGLNEKRINNRVIYPFLM